ncbi:MAG TPA: hypothetical protein VHG31_08500, partial [Stellaceae bacterium]|nr:hypothetical protein [Stellaceae bacterium]
HWIALDIDSLPCPEWIDQFDEPDRVVEYVVDLLPPEFHSASCYWAYTSGAGLKPGIRMRLWFWADRPLADWELKAWLADAPVDQAIFAPAQPTYVARPIFVDMPDPVPYRSGTWSGDRDAITPPVIERPQRGPSAASGASRGDGGGDYAVYRRQIGDGFLRNGFYRPLKGAIGAFIGEAGVGADTAWLRKDLEKAIREARRDPAKHDDAYVEARVADLDSWIEWTLGKEKEKAEAVAEPCEPTYPPPLGSVAEARAVLAETMHDIVDQVRAYHATREQQAAETIAEGGIDLNPEVEEPPPAWAINVDVGLGKTRAFREIVVAELVRDGLPVVLAVPRHKLGDEVVADLAEAGITARVYRGRDADDPDAPGEKTCREHERAAAIFAAMGNIERQACRNKRAKTVCSFYEVCGYQRQKLARPQVWLISSELLFHARPKFIAQPALLGIDESFWNSPLEGVDRQIIVSAGALLGERTVPDARMFEQADFSEFSQRAHNLIAGHDNGPLRRGALVSAGLTAEGLRYARKLEWRRKIKINDVLPGMPRGNAIRLCAWATEHNRTVARLARMWDLLARQLERGLHFSPWIRRLTEEGRGPALQMEWRRDIHPSWSAPTLVMDATLQPEIVRQFFPQIGEPIRVSAPMPHTYVRQITDKPMSAASLIETDTASDHRNQSRRNNVERVRRYIEVRAAEVWPGKVLVVCQLGLEKALKAGAVPSNVAVAHLNAITGLNSWSDVAALIVIGRTEPSPRSVERISRVLFSAVPVKATPYGAVPVEVAPDDKGDVRYPVITRGIRTRDGSGRCVEGSQHPDAQAEAVRWAICEAELIQAIGRGRGVNRTAANPLQIDILTNVCLPIEVDEITTWGAIQPSLVEVMAARGAVLRSYADMAACYPDLFANAKAAENAAAGGNYPNSSIRNPYRRFRGVFCEALYRRPGSRGPAARLLYDPARIDPAAWLAARIGPVTILSEAEPLVGDAGLGVCIGLSPPAIELPPDNIALAARGDSRAPGTARAAGTALLRIGPPPPPPPSPNPEPVEDVWLCAGLGMRSRARLVSKAIARRLEEDELMGRLGRQYRAA